VRSMDGFDQVLRKHHLPAIVREVDFGLEETYAAVLSMMEENPAMSAMVTTYHTMSIGTLKALQTLNRGVPDDFSVLGVGVDREAELVLPPLTSIEWATQDAGYQAARLLIRLIEDKNASPEQILVPPKLIVRESTGPCRK
ncbi:MAG TPA: substrate-binding domain-containing protein, partial [Aggregatilineaceae bacterium]|nr:substrate-binding domain-containing protein [Aggregatilineaceae bacterium]